MATVDWEAVEHDEFEGICYALLGRLNFENRSWCAGPNQLSRNIKAITHVNELPGRSRAVRWVVECKMSARRPIAVDDLRNSMDWVETHNPDRYLIITSSELAVGAKNWLLAKAPERIQYIERPELEELIERHLPQRYVELKSHSASLTDAGDECRGIVAQGLAELARQSGSKPARQTIEQSFSELDAYRDRSGLLPLKQQSVSLDEIHHVIYHDDGLCTSIYRLTIVNLGRVPLQFDSFRLYGDEPVFDNRVLDLSSSQLPGGAEVPTRIQFDNGYLKLVEFQLEQGVEMFDTFSYQFRVKWPYPQPLVGQRYYSTFGRRAKGRIRLVVDLPERLRLTDAMVLHSGDGVPRRIPAAAHLQSGNRLEAEHVGLNYGELFQVMFGVSRSNET